MSDPKFGTYVMSLDELFRHGDSRANDKNEEASNVQLIQEIILAIGRNDLDAVGARLADDVRLDIRGPEDLPFIREASGREEVLDAVRHNFGEVQSQQPHIEAVVAQGDTVIVVSREEGEIRATGARYYVQGVHRYVCRDRKVELVQELILPA